MFTPYKNQKMDFCLLFVFCFLKISTTEKPGVTEPLFPHERSSGSLIQDVYTVQFADFLLHLKLVFQYAFEFVPLSGVSLVH